jgi:peptidyl-prolyl cis-trans isomerase SurA
MKVAQILLAAGLLMTGAAQARPDLANAIEAVVDDSPITLVEVIEKVQVNYDRLQSMYHNYPEILERQTQDLRREQVDQLRNQRMILHEFKTAGYTLPESVVDELVQDQIKSPRYHGDRATFDKTLQQEGITREKFRQQLREQFIVTQMRRINLSPEKIIISPHKLETYYLAHREDFKEEEAVKLRVIVLKASEDTNAPAPAKLAEEILAQLNAGASFEQMATLYSQGSQRSRGGDWGWWKRTELTKGLSDIVFALPTGKCSGVISRSLGDDCWVYQYEKSRAVCGRHYGVDPKSNKQALLEERKFEDESALTNLPPAQEFYLLQVEATRPAHFRTLGEVRDEIEKNLVLEETKRLETQWMDRLKKKTFFKYF